MRIVSDSSYAKLSMYDSSRSVKILIYIRMCNVKKYLTNTGTIKTTLCYIFEYENSVNEINID